MHICCIDKHCLQMWWQYGSPLRIHYGHKCIINEGRRCIMAGHGNKNWIDFNPIPFGNRLMHWVRWRNAKPVAFVKRKNRPVLVLTQGDEDMPVRVEPRGSKFCVVSTESGETEKCYDNRADAQAYATALNMAHARKKGYINSEEDKAEFEAVKQELREWDDGAL